MWFWWSWPIFYQQQMIVCIFSPIIAETLLCHKSAAVINYNNRKQSGKSFLMHNNVFTCVALCVFDTLSIIFEDILNKPFQILYRKNVCGFIVVVCFCFFLWQTRMCPTHYTTESELWHLLKLRTGMINTIFTRACKLQHNWIAIIFVNSKSH